jgi:hypothetical protein
MGISINPAAAPLTPRLLADDAAQAQSPVVAPNGVASTFELRGARATVDLTGAGPSALPMTPEGRLDLFAAQQRLNPQDVAQLKTFARSAGISADELLAVGANVSYETADQKMMAMKSYAAARDAVKNDKLGSVDRMLFTEFVLPRLKDGSIHMNPASASQLGGAAATFNHDTRTFTGSNVDLTNIKERLVTIHELKHAAQQDRAAEVESKTGRAYQATAMQSETEAYQCSAMPACTRRCATTRARGASTSTPSRSPMARRSPPTPAPIAATC